MKDEINQVLAAYEQNWEPSPKGKEQWINAFFQHVQTKEISLVQKLQYLKIFYNTDLSEKKFHETFHNFIESCPQFISPLKYHKQLKIQEIQKIAFNLHNLIGLQYDQALDLTERLFHLYNFNQWNYETFIILLGDYDQKLKAQLLMNEFRKAA